MVSGNGSQNKNGMTCDHLEDAMFGLNPISEATIVGDGVSCETYLKQPDEVKRGDAGYVLSGSDLMEFANCPSRWIKGYKEEGTSATDYGSLLDCLLMDGVKAVFERFIILPEKYVVEKGPDKGEEKPWTFAATVCKEWRKEHNPLGKTEIKSQLWGIAQDAASQLLSDPQLAELFSTSRKQVMLTGVYVDKETGIRVPVKSLLDLVPPDVGYLADLKTTNNAHPRAWKRKVYDMDYHVQAVRHMDLWNAASGEQRNEFKHVIQENIHPFEVAKRFLSSEFVAMGRLKYTQALQKYAQCIATNVWPGYDTAESSADMVIDGWLMCSPEAWMVSV